MHNDVTNATRPEFCTEIAQLVRGHLAPGIMQKKIGQFHEKDIALALTHVRTCSGFCLRRILQTR